MGFIKNLTDMEKGFTTKTIKSSSSYLNKFLVTKTLSYLYFSFEKQVAATLFKN